MDKHHNVTVTPTLILLLRLTLCFTPGVTPFPGTFRFHSCTISPDSLTCKLHSGLADWKASTHYRDCAYPSYGSGNFFILRIDGSVTHQFHLCGWLGFTNPTIKRWISQVQTLIVLSRFTMQSQPAREDKVQCFGK